MSSIPTTGSKSSPGTRRSISSRTLGIAAAVVAGVGIALQARVNGELGHRLGDGIAAACVSFGVGLVILTCAIPWMRPGLRSLRTALATRELPLWQCLGGACGGFLVATQGLTVASLGVAVFTVSVVAGQSTSSLVVDRMGLVPGGARPITRTRAFGALLCIAAVVIAVSDRLGNASALALAALPMLAGVGIAWQQGVNGLVRQAAGAVLPATLVNFFVGSVALAVAFCVDVLVKGWPSGSLPREPWLYLGGPLGIVFIAVAAAVVRRIGVLILALGMIAGQICGALLIDSLLPGAAGTPELRTYLGAGLALAAVWLAGRQPRHSGMGSS